MNPDILFDRNETDPAIGVVTLSNPERLNAITAAMWRRLAQVFAEAEAAPDLRCLIVRGAGLAFASGGDIEEFSEARATRELAQGYHEQVGAALLAIERCPLPVVAQIVGPCIGGGLEIAAACDIRIAGESARFGAPINKLGFSMYPGEMAHLLHVVDVATLKEILLEGRVFAAWDAFEKGLVSRVLIDEEVSTEALATARRIAAGAPLVARWHKQWLNRLARGHSLSAKDKRAAFDFLDTEDYREGLAAFNEKRPPRFVGK